MPDLNKVALFGGVYNNHIALRKACEIATFRGSDAIYCLGDLGGFGPHPDKVFPILREFNVRCIQGNYEESLAARKRDCGCGYTHPKDNYYAQISYDYTDRHLSENNRRWLALLPKQLHFELGRWKVLLCHGSPRRINEFLWETTTSDGFLTATAKTFAFDILACAHSGIPWTRSFAPGKWMINVGVLGRPSNDGRQNVWYAELTAADFQPRIELIPVDYDWQALAREMREEQLPEEFIETIRTGWWTTCLEILPGKERMRGKF